jgi:hypothetical protein
MTAVHMVRFGTGNIPRHKAFISAIFGSVVEDAMPRFFFHIRSNGNGRSRDDLGIDFPSVETACSEALRVAQDFKGVFAARGQDPRDHAIEIENEAGEIVLHLTFSEIFDDSVMVRPENRLSL